MLLSEALAARAEAQERLQDLTSRVQAVVKIQEGEEPAENPVDLLADIDRLVERVEWLERAINLTNSLTPFDQGTLTDALARRNRYLLQRRLYAKFAEEAGERMNRYSATEIRYVATIDVKSMHRRADTAAKHYRELDIRIQQANWSTELIEPT